MSFLGPLGPSLASNLKRNRGLYRWIKPFADWYAGVAGYRKIGLKYDDLLVEEREDVQRALKRLTDREAYDRAFRFKRASQQSIIHQELPKEQWVTPQEDVRYLKPHVESVVEEDNERRLWDTVRVERKK